MAEKVLFSTSLAVLHVTHRQAFPGRDYCSFKSMYCMYCNVSLDLKISSMDWLQEYVLLGWIQ